jgi:type IV pilus secretin PilQ/predicted competence protein
MYALSIRNRNWWTVIILLLLMIIAVNAKAQDPADANKNKKVVLTPLQKKMQKRISVDFKETPIDDVLRSMAAQVDIDIIKSPKVIGEVSASLTDIPLDEALRNILSTHGYGYIVSNNMIRVVPEAEMHVAVQKMANRVYRITYADVTDVYNAIKIFVSQNANITFNKGTSNLMVTAPEDKIDAIDKFITEVDRITAQILVEARLYDITTTDSLDLGVEWTIGRRSGYDPGVGTLGGASGKTDPFITGLFNGTTSAASATDALLRVGILNSTIDIDAIIRAEQENIQAKLLANPKIMVLDNHEALIKIVEEIPFQELTETSAGGSIGTTEFREVGVELLVIPHITRDGMIRLDLYPQFSTETRKTEPAGVNNPLPQPVIARREAQTTTLIKDGETVVIGGLKKESLVQSQNKIPLLGDLPLLGGLFKFESEKTVNSELVIFITPHIVKRRPLTPTEMRQFQDTNFKTNDTPLTRVLKTDKKK